MFSILATGTREQKEKYALPLVWGEKIGCWGLTEPEAGSDIRSMKTTWKKQDDYYLLNGQKTFITNAPIAEILVVYAHNPEKGYSAFILERGMEGLETSPPFEKMGMECSPTGAIYLDQVKVPKENLLGKEGEALFDAFRVLTLERTVTPALMIGIMERALEEAVKYARQRVQFGRPIIKFQAVQFLLARMWEKLLASYWIWIYERSRGGKAGAGCQADGNRCWHQPDSALMEMEEIELNPLFFGPGPFEKII